MIAFSAWWAILLYQKNKQAYEELVELQSLIYERDNPGEDFAKSAQFKELEKEYNGQRIMIFSEGFVFLSILAFGLFKVRDSFTKEFALANQQRNFLLSITHELKSPLASIKLTLQTLLSRDLKKEQSNKLLNNSLFDVDRLEGLVDNILFAARIDNENYGFARESINLSQFIHDLTNKYEDSGAEFSLDIQDDVWFEGDRTGLMSVLINLIDNAIKYSQPPVEIDISLKQSNSGLILQVGDNGLGIPDNEKASIFQKFYRVGNEDTRTTKGTGLGLFIVKRVIEIHNGQIEILDNKPQGTIFKVTLPGNPDIQMAAIGSSEVTV